MEVPLSSEVACSSEVEVAFSSEVVMLLKF